ncbi:MULTISPECIES: hypothetical protein [unclassified Campylobacter]|uniref:hypothetical protein n=1 Tax=unclassified Campylobacter TaxID=2593542 RepID=UPI001BD92C9F|nr:hypothetical protein [Campylobacter sp. 2018MI10]MBT0884703.1 hypothetical protein [Campylobacter sp. 2018MI10]MBZ7976008.1 hypothetical protein [Campylobacter sp. RM12637]MBZ7983456.1 hypothetical protein [Campylobacter sp. RM12647]MBZ7992974.1 hypothetical protein [Campylobacter sp. RM9333]
MEITNFSELINAKIINKPSVSRLKDFCLNLNSVTNASAFFTNEQALANEAIKKGAYAIISTKDLSISDKEVAFLKINDFEFALTRLLAFYSIDKRVVLLDELSIECLNRLNITTLKNDLFYDFENILKNNLIFCSSKEYLDKLSLSYENVKYSYEIIKRSSFFYQDLILNDEYYYNVFIPIIFTEQFAKINVFKELNINYSNLKLLDFIFLNDNNEIVKMSEGSKVVFFENNELIISEIKKHLNLFEITEIKNHTYMLYKGDKNKFINELNVFNEGLFL